MHAQTLEQGGTVVDPQTYWTALISIAAGLLGGGGIFAGVIRWRADRDVKQIESDGHTERAQIAADSTERISVISSLASRVGELEDSFRLQARELRDLGAENATLRAQNQLLTEQNKLLKRMVGTLEREKTELIAEVQLLRDAIQGPISEALESLDELSGETE